MDSIIILFLFAFGLIVGSFLNVVILRYNTGKNLHGRSACFSCGQTLRWHHLIPLVSFLVLRGRCAFCGSKISIQYPLVELATALLFVFSDLLTPISGLPFALIVVSLLMIIFVYDLRHKIIPDGIAYVFVLLGLTALLARHNIFIDLVSAFCIFIFFFSLWYFSEGSWMGLGDGKLALAMSLFLPWPLNLSAIIIAFWIGAAFGLLLIAYEKILGKLGAHSMKSELPFAPFMIIAFFLVLFTDFNLIALLVV